MSEKFAKPVKFETATGRKLTFRELGELKDWFNKQEADWAPIKSSRGSHVAQVQAKWNNITQPLRHHLKAAQNKADSEDQIPENLGHALSDALVGAFGAEGFPTSDSPLGKFILELSDRQLAAAVLALHLGVNSQSNSFAWRGAAHLAIFELGLHGGGADAAKGILDGLVESYRTKLEEHRHALDDAHKEVGSFRDQKEGELEELKAQLDGQLNDASTRLREQLEDVKAKLALLENLYDEKLALRAPVTYWAKKEKRHCWAAVWWGLVFGVSLLAAGAGLDYLFDRLLGGPGSIGLSSVAAFGVLTVPIFWVLRVVSRNFLSNLHLRTDAAERVVMLKTYLSLLRKGQISDKERELALVAIFRPSATGIVADDAPPTNLAEILGKTSN